MSYLMDVAMRWGHVVFGVTWIGLLYYFNFVQTEYVKEADIWGKSIEEILVSPTPNLIILLAYICGGVARGVLVGLIVTSVSLLFTDLSIFNGWVLASVVVLTAILFSLGGFINAVFAKTFDDVSIHCLQW